MNIVRIDDIRQGPTAALFIARSPKSSLYPASYRSSDSGPSTSIHWITRPGPLYLSAPTFWTSGGSAGGMEPAFNCTPTDSARSSVFAVPSGRNSPITASLSIGW